MAIAYRSQNFTSPATTNPIVCSPPSGIANDDILIATVFGKRTFGAVGPYTAPAGWTQIDTVALTDGTSQGTHTVWWKRAASESGSYSFNDTVGVGTTNQSAHIAAYSGCATSGSPIDVYSKANGTGVNSVATSITTSVANTYLFLSDSTWTNGGSGSWNTPTGMTLRIGGGGTNGGIGIFDEARAASGATGTRTATNLNAAGQPWSALLLALLPAGTGPTGTLAATEATDIAAFAGSTFIQGVLAATEAADVAAFAGSFVAPSGPLVAVEAPDVAAFAGNAGTSGILSAIEPPDVGGVPASGPLAAIEPTDIASFTGSVPAVVITAIPTAWNLVHSQPDPNKIRRRTAESREVGEPWVTRGYTEVAGSLVTGETTGVIIAAGQSNIGNYVSGAYTPTQTRAHMLNVMDGGVYNIQDPVMGCNGGLPGTLGFDVSNCTTRMVDKLRAAGWRQRVILANVSGGGTSTTQWATGDCEERIRAICSRVLGWHYVPTVILWHQGEQNYALGIGAVQTRDEIRAIKQRFVDYGVVCPMLVCRVAYNTFASVGTLAYNNVRQGQLDAASSSLGIFSGPDTDVYQAAYRKADDLHWNATGSDAVSTDIKNAIMGLVP